MVKPWFFTLIFGLLLSLPPFVLADKTLSSGVDRTLVEQGDIIQLTVQANFQTTSNGPDFEPLKTDFEVLGVQSSSQLRVINGQFTATTQWDSQLVAKRQGHITIPSFEVDSIRSKPIQIEVSAPSQIQAQYKISFLEASVDNPNPYVQSQVIYTLRYYHLGSLVRGNIDPPQFDNALSERLKNQHSFERRVEGRVYRVYEWVYALYPQTSGELLIPPQTFEGTLLQDRQIRLVNEQTQPIKLQVKPIPANYPNNQAWLPAKSLQLKQQWIHDDPVKVGDTLTRQIQLHAMGLKVSQLPDITLNSTKDYRIYSDPVNQNEHISDQGISSNKSRDFMAVLQQSGQLSFAPIEMPWWNTETDQLEIAKLDGQTLMVEANSAQQHAQIDMPMVLTNPKTESMNYWLFISASLAVLWLLTLMGWLMTVIRNKRQPDPTAIATTNIATTNTDSMASLTAESRHKFTDLSALFTLPSNQWYAAIKHWLATEHGIYQLKQLNPQTELAKLLQQLERQTYYQTTNEQNDPIEAARLTKALQDFSAATDKTAASAVHKLRPLYP